ncbi:MAG: hypothetical protein ABS79_06270 [Planctomycetes bacterium SCN 63-9]|nr:MAG: hypothetical protein ABS79_06270 [Planctomycetes bacterium SCN 63-9]
MRSRIVRRFRFGSAAALRNVKAETLNLVSQAGFQSTERVLLSSRNLIDILPPASGGGVR